MKEHLILGKRTNGKYYVRPITWAGIWDADGNLKSGNVLIEFDTEEECVEYIKHESNAEVNGLRR